MGGSCCKGSEASASEVLIDVAPGPGVTASDAASVQLTAADEPKAHPPENAVAHARDALEAALTMVEAASPGEAATAAQAEVEERAVRYAAALVACPGELPPEGTYTDPASLFAALRPKTEGALVPVRLLRSSWIKARAARLRAATSEEERRRLALPRRQALERDEPGAFLSADEMEALPRHRGKYLALGASSYCWLTGAAGGARTHAADAWEAHRHPPSLVTAAHPDPLGEQLVSLAAAIERAEAKKSVSGYRDGFPSEAGFFIDFASIHQKDAAGERTPEERAAFAEALSTMQLWYAHTKTTAFLTRALPDGYDGLPGYAERGWTTCESSWAALAKQSTTACWAPIWDVAGGAAYRRPPPMAPPAMARLVASRRFTSKKGDLPLVIEINTRTILSLFRDVEKLAYRELGWGDAEAAQLCEVLPLCASLKGLNLHANAIGDAGVAALLGAIAGGALPTLETLGLNRNPIGAAGQAALAAAIRGGGLGRLKKLFVGSASAELRAACEGRGIGVW